MNIRAENKKRIRELEAEFSDERIDEIFAVDEQSRVHVSGRQGRLTGRVLLRRGLIIGVIIAAVIVVMQFFTFIVAVEESMGGAVMERDCMLVAKHGAIQAGDIVAYEVQDTYDNGGLHDHFGLVVSFSGGMFEIEDSGPGERPRYVGPKQVRGKVLFRVFPLSRSGYII